MYALFLCAFLLAANSQSAPVERSLQSLIDRAMQDGIPRETVGKRTAKNLGFKPSTPVRAMWFEQDSTPDGFEHVFKLVLEGEKPSSLLWQKSRLTTEADSKHIVGEELLVSLSGEFKAGWAFVGVPGKSKDTPISKKDGKLRAAREKRFWTIDSVGWAWGTK